MPVTIKDTNVQNLSAKDLEAKINWQLERFQSVEFFRNPDADLMMRTREVAREIDPDDPPSA